MPKMHCTVFKAGVPSRYVRKGHRVKGITFAFLIPSHFRPKSLATVQEGNKIDLRKFLDTHKTCQKCCTKNMGRRGMKDKLLSCFHDAFFSEKPKQCIYLREYLPFILAYLFHDRVILLV